MHIISIIIASGQSFQAKFGFQLKGDGNGNVT